jgi:hypothetical protein
MKTSLHVYKDQFAHTLHTLHRYAPLLLFVFLIGIYAFLSYRIITLTQAQPAPSAVSAELKTVGIPKVDEEVVSKMEQLEDNSVSVQTLFDDARSNPFEE